MTAWYRIRGGERFVTPAGELKCAGELIELEADVAALHAARLERTDQPDAAAAPPFGEPSAVS